MKTGYRILFTVLLTAGAFFSANYAYSDVFTLAPFKGGKPWGADILGGAELWQEPLNVNGLDVSMKLTLIDKDIVDSCRILKQSFPDAVFKINGESVFVEIKRENGGVERLYLVYAGGGLYPVIQFSMELPDKIPANPEWPAELPAVSPDKITSVINLPDRNTLYGTFVSQLSSEQIYSDISAKMSASGWTSPDKGIYLKNDPVSLILVTVTGDDAGRSHVAVLRRLLRE